MKRDTFVITLHAAGIGTLIVLTYLIGRLALTPAVPAAKHLGYSVPAQGATVIGGYGAPFSLYPNAAFVDQNGGLGPRFLGRTSQVAVSPVRTLVLLDGGGEYEILCYTDAGGPAPAAFIGYAAEVDTDAGTFWDAGSFTDAGFDAGGGDAGWTDAGVSIDGGTSVDGGWADAGIIAGGSATPVANAVPETFNLGSRPNNGSGPVLELITPAASGGACYLTPLAWNLQ